MQIYRTMLSLITGPSRENQDELMSHKACDAILTFLVFYQYDDEENKVHTLTMYRKAVDVALMAWKKFFRIDLEKNIQVETE